MKPFLRRLTLARTPRPEEMLAALPAGPGRILLESGLAGDSAGGLGAAQMSMVGTPCPGAKRWSFATAEPYAILKGQGDVFDIVDANGTLDSDSDPFALLDRLNICSWDNFRHPWDEERSETEAFGPKGLAATGADVPPFRGGAAGYFAYDLNRHVEQLPVIAKPELSLPDLYLGLYELVMALDHERDEVWLVGTVRPGREAQVLAQASRWEAALQQITAQPAVEFTGPLPTGSLSSDFTREAYYQAVAQAQAYIAAGDVAQVNLSQRFAVQIDTASDADWGWRLFRRLREVNPAPFSAYVEGPDFAIASASPERFLSVEPRPAGQWRVETRPIKGTRRRGDTPEADAALAQSLLASEKDRAELRMIVDLACQDLSRIAQPGTVRVADPRRLESFPTVHHTVATVEGVLKPGVNLGGLLRATFPGASVTGEPKGRAMAIIDQLEPVRRHVYCGSIGYLSFSGHMDLNVAIRTVTICAGKALFHAGGAVVANSNPEAEYDETLAKAIALATALGVRLP